MKKKLLKPRNEKLSKIAYKKQSIETLRLHYRFWVLFSILILAAVCVVLRIETPGVWTFLCAAGGWAVLTSK
jgi:hypothetical protein